MRNKGFTLIEVAAAVVLMALLAGAVSVTFFGWHSRAQMAGVVERVKHFDRISREYARTGGRQATLLVRALDSQLIYTEGAIEDLGIFDDETHNPNLRVCTLPKGYRIERVMIDRNEGDISETVVTISSRGQTPTYGLQITNDKAEQVWLVFAGLTGQIIETKDDYQTQDIFSLLATNSGTDLN